MKRMIKTTLLLLVAVWNLVAMVGMYHACLYDEALFELALLHWIIPTIIIVCNGDYGLW